MTTSKIPLDSSGEQHQYLIAMFATAAMFLKLGLT